jgi:hypothetical protein
MEKRSVVLRLQFLCYFTELTDHDIHLAVDRNILFQQPLKIRLYFRL